MAAESVEIIMAAQRSMLKKTAIVSAVLSFFVLPAAAAWTGSDDNEAQAAANAMVVRFTDAWNCSDSATFGENYWPEAEVRYPGANILRGRSAIIREHLNLWAGPFKGSHAEGAVRGIQLLGADRLLIDADLVISWIHRTPSDSLLSSPVVKTHLKYTLEKRNGVWKVLSGENSFAGMPRG
jgi:uncharacterized protein (TIGR02246 family)